MSQEKQITLQVDVANDSNLVATVFDHIRTEGDRSLYICDGSHSDADRDILEFSRIDPKPGGNSFGTRKSFVKFTQDDAVPAKDGINQNTLPVIGEVKFSVPVGVTAATKLALRQRIIALLDDDAVMDALMDHGEI